jgi:hypothetical protein
MLINTITQSRLILHLIHQSHNNSFKTDTTHSGALEQDTIHVIVLIQLISMLNYRKNSHDSHLKYYSWMSCRITHKSVL